MMKMILAGMMCGLLPGLVLEAQPPSRYDVVICEIMADPSPPVGLPNAEYIELRNVSSRPIPLSGWKISDATGTATINATFILQPDSLVILCSNSNVPVFSSWGRTIGVSSFPSLDNDGEELVLRSPQNRVVHTVSYSVEWLENEVKKEGGWSLEMIDAKNPCGPLNWKASKDVNGGTPGRINSVDGANPDTQPPSLRRAYAASPYSALLLFDEAVDSLSASNPVRYKIDGAPAAQAFQTAAWNLVQLQLPFALEPGKVYSITAEGVTDCAGNAVGQYRSARLALFDSAAAGDLVINEILFNPAPGGGDYVELFNRGKKTIDARDLYLANRNSSGAAGTPVRISLQPFPIFPGDYVVVTAEAGGLQMLYHVKNPDAVLSVPALPSMPDDEGSVLLLDRQGGILDEVHYNEDWHFALITEPEGVSLERIDPNEASQEQGNWHSAASTAGYGTPGYRNSQYKIEEKIKGTIVVEPGGFSPDNDGYNDLAFLRYNVAEPGFVVNVFILDANGRQVRHLVKNGLMGLQGSWAWDGLDEKRRKLSVGVYIVVSEIFNLKGRKQTFRQTLVLAGKL
jgi:hypothetical protein